MSEGRGEHEFERQVPELEPAVLKWEAGARAEPSGRNVDLSSEPRFPSPRELTAGDFGQRRRRVFLPVFLFLATCVSTFIAGSLNWDAGTYLVSGTLGQTMADNWLRGLVYSGAVIGILLTHEMGHFIQTLRYRVPASLPFFIPVPFLVTGTMGAVIGMEGSRADRKQLFDIGISGPWAGLLVALPITYVGILRATPLVGNPPIVLGDPLIFKLMAHFLRPDIAPEAILDKSNALLMAGWVGMLITGLNMLPISQLDGGHVIYGLFGRRSRLVARAFMIAGDPVRRDWRALQLDADAGAGDHAGGRPSADARRPRQTRLAALDFWVRLAGDSGAVLHAGVFVAAPCAHFRLAPSDARSLVAIARPSPRAR